MVYKKYVLDINIHLYSSSSSRMRIHLYSPIMTEISASARCKPAIYLEEIH